MSTSEHLPPPIRSVLHATDLSEDSAPAFVHALKIALVRRARFDILNVDAVGTPWHRFPQVRRTLERWGVIAPDSKPESVLPETGIDVSKVAKRHRNAAKAILEYLLACPADLLVLSTARRRGAAQLVRPSVAERVARRARVPTLFVPAGARGFVNPDDGTLALRRVVVPIDHEPSPQPAVDAVVQVFTTIRAEPEAAVLAHAGETPPAVDLRYPKWHWEETSLDGPVADDIAAVADEVGADLIVMTSAGRGSLGDVLRGSTTERVVRRAPCPVLVVPVTVHRYR